MHPSYYQERLSQGLCWRCGKAPFVLGRTRCKECAALERSRYRANREAGLCGQCGEHSPAEGRARCSGCLALDKENGAAARVANPISRDRQDKVNAQQRRWVKENPSTVRARYLRKTYGLTPAKWEAIFVAQGRRCGICGRTEPDGRDKTRAWHTDHDHVSGKVRGILCGGCNMGLGCFGDSVEAIRGAMRYLKRFKPQASAPAKNGTAQLALISGGISG